jgi:microsomal epoxide hydrolase
MLVSAAGGLVAGAAAPDERSRPLRAMRIRIPEEKIVDLKARLERTRWPDQVIGAGWDYGTNLEYLEELCRYWARDFDWRGQERSLNRFAHHHTDIDGLRLHYVLQRGRGPSPLPLILFHGWPGSFYQMLKLAPLLADPAGHGGSIEDSFDVVVPSLPGYGFSSRPSQQGWTQRRFARLFATLMTERLGYRRFCAHGGDIGAGVVNQLALQFPGRLHGLHLTNVARPYLGPGSRPLSEAERRLVAQEDAWSAEEGAYADLQRTRPQTPTYGLNDSPAGLASWIVEKWRAWSDCNGDIESVFTKDELLTNISLYWFTETIGSSMRVYYEHRRHAPPLGAGDRITPPAGFALFPRDLSNPPREWAERTYDVASWTVMPRGGHFATMEQPQLVAEDIRRFFRRFR